MPSSKNKCIVSVIVVADADQCQISFEDNRYTEKVISTAGCFENIEKCSDFIKNITSLIPVDEIKALVMTFPAKASIKMIQMVKERIKEFCEKNGIFHAFPPHLGLRHLGMLCAAKPINIKDGEIIILVSAASFDVNSQVFKLNNQKEFVASDGFRVIVSPNFSPSEIKERIIKDYVPKKIIILDAAADNKYAKIFNSINYYDRVVQALSSCDTIVLEENSIRCDQSSAEILIKHSMGEKESEYMVKFICDRDINVANLIKCGASDILPLEKSVVYKVKKSDRIKVTETNHGVIQSIDLSQYAFQQVRITLTVDENMFYDVKVEPIVAAEKSVLIKPAQELKQTGPKAKLILTQNDYMIFAWKNGKKKVIKDSTGATKVPYCISFANEIPSVGTSAMKDLTEKPEFVVYDLLKLCQVNVLKNIDRKWPFKVISDNADQGISIQFETFRGPRETSVNFLLGMILKSSKVLIEKEMGIKVEEFGIEFESVFDGQEFIRRCLEKGAERIKIKVTFL